MVLAARCSRGRNRFSKSSLLARLIIALTLIAAMVAPSRLAYDPQSFSYIGMFARFRALASSGAQRMPAAMEVPTIAELGHPGYEASSWQGVLGLPGLPDAVRDRLNVTIRQVIADPLVAQKMRDSGAEPESSTASAFAEHIRSEVHKWAQLVRAKGIQTER